MSPADRNKILIAGGIVVVAIIILIFILRARGGGGAAVGPGDFAGGDVQAEEGAAPGEAPAAGETPAAPGATEAAEGRPPRLRRPVSAPETSSGWAAVPLC
jgi:hypothetical protein